MEGRRSSSCDKRKRSVSPPKTFHHYEQPTIESLNKQTLRPCSKVTVKVTTSSKYPPSSRSPRLCEGTNSAEVSVLFPDNQIEYDSESTVEDQAQYLGEDSSEDEWDDGEIPRKLKPHGRGEYNHTIYESRRYKADIDNLATDELEKTDQATYYTKKVLKWVNELRNTIERMKKIHDTANRQLKEKGIFPKPPKGVRPLDRTRKDRIARPQTSDLNEEILSLKKNAEVIEKCAMLIHKRWTEDENNSLLNTKNFKDKLSSMSDECEMLREKLKQAKNKLDMEKKKGDEALHTLLLSKIDEYDKVVEVFNQVTDENKELRDKNSNLEAVLQLKCKTYEDQNNKILCLEKEGTKLKHPHNEVKRLKEHVGKLLKENTELRRLETEFHTCRAKIARQEQEIDKYKKIASKEQRATIDPLNKYKEHTLSKELQSAKTTQQNLQKQIRQLEAKCQKYEEDVKLKDQEIRDKTREIENFLSESPRRMKEDEKHAKEMLQKERELRCWKRKYEETCSKMNDQCKEIEGYASVLQRREAEYKLIQQNYNRLKDEQEDIERYKSALQSKEAAYSHLQSKYNRLKDQETEFERCRSTLQLKEAEYTHLHSEYIRMKDQEKEIERYRSTLERKEAEYALLQNEYKSLTDVQENISDLRVQLESSKRDYLMLHKEFDGVNDRLLEEKAKNASDINTQILRKDELTRVVTLMEEEMLGLKKELEDKKQNVSDLKEEIQKGKRREEKTKLEIKKRSDDFHQLQCENENMKEEFKVFRERIIAKEETNQNLVDEKTQIVGQYSEIEAKLSSQIEINTEYKRKLQKMHIMMKKLETDKEERASAAEKEKEHSIRSMEDELKRVKSELTRVQTVSKSLERIKEKAAEADRKVAEKDHTINSLEEALKHIKRDLERTKEKLKKIKQEKNNEEMHAQEKILEMSKEKAKEEQQQREWESTLSSKDKQIVNLTKQLESFKKNISTITKNKDEMEENFGRNIEILKRENISLHEQVITLKSRVSEQEEKNTEAKKSKEELQIIKEKLEKENSSLRLQLENLNDRLEKTEEKLEHIKQDKMSTEEQYWSIENKIKEKDSLIAKLEASHETLLVKIEEERNRILFTEDERKDERKENDTIITSLQLRLSEANETIQQMKQEDNILKETCLKQTNMLKEREKLVREAESCISRLEEFRIGYDTMKKDKENAEKCYFDLSREIERREKEIDSLKHQLNRFEDLAKECNELKRDKQNVDNKVLRMSKALQEKEKEAECLAEKLARSEENASDLSNKIKSLQRKERHDNEEVIQRLQKENNSLKAELERLNTKAHEQISVLNKEIKNLHKSKGLDSEESVKKLHRENTNLKSDLERITSSLDQLRKDYTEVKREKDHALNRLSSVAGEKLRDNNPGIADLSDENRPINLGEKFSQLYDDQWTDAMENLEENLGVGETEGIQCLLSILKSVFDECVRISDDQFTQLKEITGTTNLPSDQLKKLKDLRKSTALQSVKNVKQLVNKAMSSVFSKEKDACLSYIDRCTELCWLMCVQDPPVVIDFTAVRGQVVDDKMLRKFTKTGSKIDFLVWPMIRLHKNGPLLQKGVVQPL